MTSLLHILTKSDDDLASEIISLQRQKASMTVKTFDLTQSEPDYRALLEEIFDADSVTVW
jgi:hypothetical protein